MRKWAGPNHSQSSVHLLEGLLNLLEEVEDQRLGELALALVLIHLQDLGESAHVDMVAEIWQGLLVLRKTSVVSCQVEQQQRDMKQAGG